VLAAHQEHDDAFVRDDTFDGDCADNNAAGRCACDPHYIPEHMIDDANAIEDEMARWPEAVVGYADAVAVILAGRTVRPSAHQPTPA
jgi:hypothetical protein